MAIHQEQSLNELSDRAHDLARRIGQLKEHL
jgi:hypothetical protein